MLNLFLKRWFLLTLFTNLIFVSPVAANGKVNLVRVPDEGIHPHVAVDKQGNLHMIYFKGDPRHGDIFYVRSADGGKTFSSPMRVNSQPESVIVAGTVRGPQLALGKDGRVHVAWMGAREAIPKAPQEKAPMLYAQLNDEGTAFEPQRNLIQKKPGLDGGGSVAADSLGNVYVAWHAPDTVGGEQDRRIWITRSNDGGKTFSIETAAFSKPTGACACCGMKVFTDNQGTVYALYRSADGSGTRDMYLLASRDAGSSFSGTKIHEWEVDYCPMSTSSFWGDGLGVLAAWETEKQIYFAEVHPTEASISNPISVPGAGQNRKHPGIARNADGQILVAWTEGTGWEKGGTVEWQLFDKNGHPIVGQHGRTEGVPVWGRLATFVQESGDFTIVY